MFPAFLALLITLLAVSAPASSRPVTLRGYYKQPRQEPIRLHSLADAVGGFPEINVLIEGNQRFRDSIANSDNPNLLKEQTDAGQSPSFLFLGCRCVSFASSPGH